MNEMPLRAMALMSAFAVAWVLVEEVIGRTMSRPYPLLQIVWCRYAVHLALMLLFNSSAPSRLWRTRRLAFHLARSLLMLVMPAAFAMSLQADIPSGSVWALFWIAPLLVLALGWGVLGEAVSPRAWWTCGLGALAAVVMMANRETTVGPALMLPVIMAASFAGYVVMTRQLEGELLQTNLFYTACGVFVALTPVVPWTWVTPPIHDIAELFGIGAVGLLALWALDRAVASASLSISIPAIYLHLPTLMLVAWAMEGDLPSLREAMGGALICVAVTWIAWVAWAESQQPQRRPGRATT